MSESTNPTSDLRELGKIPGFDDRPSISQESADELDKLVKAKETPLADPPADKKDDPADNSLDPPADKKDDVQDPSEKKADDPPAPAAKADDFDAIQLPPYSKPKTNESFDKLKTLARERVSAAETERDALKKERDELTAKLGNGLPVEIETELKELRAFRNKLDVEADPEFKTFDKSITDNVESIYSRLKAGGFTDEHIEQVKKLGGPSEVDWESLSSKLSPALKRFIDSKLVENETISDKKTRAIEEAKKNAEEYLRVKQEAQTGQATQHSKQVELKVKELVPQLGWLEERKPKDGATEVEKGVVAAHNKLVKESNEFLTQAVSDNSPELRSLLAVGYVQLLKARSDIERLKTDKDGQIKTLEGKLKEATELLDKVKNSSTARLQLGSTPDNVSNPTTDNINIHPSQAIDTLLKERMAAK
jgi:hypothetical protein